MSETFWLAWINISQMWTPSSAVQLSNSVWTRIWMKCGTYMTSYVSSYIGKLPSSNRTRVLLRYHLIRRKEDCESTLMRTFLRLHTSKAVKQKRAPLSQTHAHARTHTLHIQTLHKYQQTDDIALCWPSSDGIIFKVRERERERGVKTNGEGETSGD